MKGNTMGQAPLYIDIHVLQTLPPSCVNRDDTGSPKTARFGGVRRARVSSQAWKKAMRDDLADLLDDTMIGQRTKDAVGIIAERIELNKPELSSEDVFSMAEDALKATGVSVKNGKTDYLLFISPLQAEALASLAIDARETGTKIAGKEVKTILNPKERPTLNAADIALFGRMVADAPNLNVDAASQVAHAIGIEEANTEFDYYTAMDDRSPDDNAGAGMIGTVEFLSSTLYRYATLDVYHLCENLGAVGAAVETSKAFIRAFVHSMPTGKQNTFANRTMPSVVVIQLRDSQPVSLANAFEQPVRPYGGKSTIEIACERLVAQEQCVDDAFGLKPKMTYVVCAAPGTDSLKAIADELTNISGATEKIGEVVSSYLHDLGFAEVG